MAMTSKPVAGCETGAELPRLDLASPNLAEEAKAALRDLFPQAFDEQGQLDFARLRELLAEFADGDKSRYGLSWAGKQDAKRALLSQSVGTLAPMRGESVGFDETENLIIEGDNLEVLKLLQKAYYGKVKMIYIDPPYNTGNEFIYPDNFREGLQDYLKYSGQVSEEGFRTSTNTETSGRYHSNWLNMMYPRLALARNLLREDGVIFVSIDDHEVHNLRMLMDEVFGEENFVGQLIWRKKYTLSFRDEHLIQIHEYIVSYKRSGSLTLVDPRWDNEQTVAVNPVFKSQNAPSMKVIRRGAALKGGGDTTIQAGDKELPSQTIRFHSDAVFRSGLLQEDVSVTAGFAVGQDTLDNARIEVSQSGAAYVLLPGAVNIEQVYPAA
jgi:hypothetical protein